MYTELDTYQTCCVSLNTERTRENMEPSREKTVKVPPMKRAAGRKRATAVAPAAAVNASPKLPAIIAKMRGPVHKSLYPQFNHMQGVEGEDV